MGPGGVLGITSDRDDRMEPKVKTQKNPLGFQQNPKKSLDQKNPLPILWPLKDPERGNAITQRTAAKHICLYFIRRAAQPDTTDSSKYPPKKSLLKSSYQKKYLPNFCTQKNSKIENFKPKKILSSSLSLEIQSTPLGQWGGGRLYQ